MKKLPELKINKPLITIFASGNSILNLTDEDFSLIRNKSFTIGLNYSVLKYHTDMIMWSDKKPSDFLQSYFSNNLKTQYLLSREKAFSQEKHKVLIELVDFWFDERKDNLIGNYTIVWLIQLLKKTFPHMPIAIFGLDMIAPSNDQAKWYDKFTTIDKDHRGSKYPVWDKLKQCAEQMDRIENKDRIWNCNPQSLYKGFTFLTDWRAGFKEIR